MIVVVLGLVILLSVNRVLLIGKTAYAAVQTGRPEWKAWRLSAVEPLITNLLIFGALVSSEVVFGLIIPLNLLVFSWMIYRVGNKHQRGRLAITIIMVRLILMLALLFYVMITSTLFELFGAICAFLIILIPTLFSLYQAHVTPTKTMIDRMTRIDFPLLESDLDDVIILDHLDLWDEQVKMIERLKAEEEARGQSMLQLT